MRVNSMRSYDLECTIWIDDDEDHQNFSTPSTRPGETKRVEILSSGHERPRSRREAKWLLHEQTFNYSHYPQQQQQQQQPQSVPSSMQDFHGLYSPSS